MNTYTILAVDDEPINLELIKAAFEVYPHIYIHFASCAKQGLALLEYVRFDAVLLDISMPHMSGLDMLREIREVKKMTTLPVLMVTASPEKEQEALDLGATDFIRKPYSIDALRARTLNYVKLYRYTQIIENEKELLEQKVQERTQELQEALQLAKRSELEISIRLGMACESRDHETGWHIRRMSYYSQLLAKLCGLSEKAQEMILYAAPLHDIGKIAIPDYILLKPGKLDEDEYKLMQKHTEFGAELLAGAEDFPVIEMGRIIALEHHEKFDGTGYPRGLKGDEIHLFARIVAIADVFDALSSKRCYKEAMAIEEVFEVMKNEAGRHFDPELIKLLLSHKDQFLEIREIYRD